MLDAITDLFVKAVLPGLASLVAAAVLAVLRQQFKRLGLEVSSQNEARIKQIVYDAVLRVEELARRNRDMTSAEKRTAAVAEARAKLPTMSDAQVAEMIDAALPVLRSRGLSNPPQMPAPAVAAPGKKTAS